MTGYDAPRDPLADLNAAIARINAARPASEGRPLEFDVPALTGYQVHRADPDAALDDQAAFMGHALRVPPAGWSSGWIAHPATIEHGLSSALYAGRRDIGYARVLGSLPAGSNILTDLPVWSASDAPPDVIVPVYIRQGGIL